MAYTNPETGNKSTLEDSLLAKLTVEVMDRCNCTDCIDCIDCKACVGCVSCIDCEACTDCTDCIDCIDCEDCKALNKSAYMESNK